MTLEWEMFFPTGLAAPVSRSCPLETKDEYEVLEVGPGEFRANYIIYQYLTRLTAYLEALRAGHHMFDHSGGGRANA